MHRKASIDLNKIRTLKDSEIKIGDTVRLKDGSVLSLVDNYYTEHYIVCSYPNVTGSHLKLMDIDCEVLEVGLTNFICPGIDDNSYLQDILVQVGKAKFRTASKLVRKV